MKVLIVGAGIAGLSMALALERAGCEVDVWERRPVLPEAGGGIVIWPNGERILHYYGLHLTTIGEPLDAVLVHDLAGAALGRSPLDALSQRFNSGVFPVARRELLQLILRGLRDTNIHFCRGFSRYAETGEGIIAYDDQGVSAPADFIVGADGIHSRARDQARMAASPFKLGVTHWVALLDENYTPCRTGMEYLDNGLRLGIMPVRQGQSYVRVSSCASHFRNADHRQEAEAPPQRTIEALFRNAGPAVRSTLVAMLASSAKWQAIEEKDIEAAASMVNGRVALAGDAAHAMTAGLGQGGNQGIEDAFVLGELCSRMPGRNVAQMLLQYEKQRLGRVQAIQRQSREKSLLLTRNADLMSKWYDDMQRISHSDSLGSLESMLQESPVFTRVVQ